MTAAHYKGGHHPGNGLGLHYTALPPIVASCPYSDQLLVTRKFWSPGANRPSQANVALLGELKERIRAVLMTRIDPSVAGRIPRARLRGEVAQLVSEIATEDRAQLNKLEEATLAADLSDDMIGLGPLEPYLDDDEVTDILANGPFDVYVERRGKLEKTAARFRDAQHLVNVAQRIASAIGRRIDEASPMVDARLADGSRVNIVLPPLVLNGGCISIRK